MYVLNYLLSSMTTSSLATALPVWPFPEMERKDTIQNAYRLRGSNNFYDGMITCSILDRKGADKLTGKGDALVKLPEEVNPIRFQAPLISNSDITPVVRYWSKQ